MVDRGKEKGVEQSRKIRLGLLLKREGVWVVKIIGNEKDDHTNSCECVT